MPDDGEVLDVLVAKANYGAVVGTVVVREQPSGGCTVTTYREGSKPLRRKAKDRAAARTEAEKARTRLVKAAGR